MEDVFFRLLIRCGPALSIFRDIPSKKVKKVSTYVIQLLKLREEQEKYLIGENQSDDDSEIDDDTVNNASDLSENSD